MPKLKHYGGEIMEDYNIDIDAKIEMMLGHDTEDTAEVEE